jgi:hypothetical protein
MTDKVRKIKEWISKTQDGLMDANGNFEYPEHEGAYHILCNLDAYIDSLQEEPVSEEWIDAAKQYVKEHVIGIDKVTFSIATDMFISGAKWQKQQDQSTIELAEDHAMLAGMEKMKEQMMAKAIDGTARPDDNEIWCNLSTFNLKDGDKCKVILIKEG